jgi:hypothetical protein
MKYGTCSDIALLNFSVGEIKGGSVSFADIQKCAAGTHHYYLWGWVDYNDVFEDTPRRRSEFCF